MVCNKPGFGQKIALVPLFIDAGDSVNGFNPGWDMFKMSDQAQNFHFLIIALLNITD